ncbi:hypothetical protein A6R68_22737 [Neotoma lepida]|uniref:Uncharacterized protein n=1 Tax=Neotoma lepida TaxID=56216 RepID=A0A1A6HXR7_NEOLE|nr:hypothetical protein A6R68_22737 [Neotoma lepida]
MEEHGQVLGTHSVLEGLNNTLYTTQTSPPKHLDPPAQQEQKEGDAAVGAAATVVEGEVRA